MSAKPPLIPQDPSAKRKTQPAGAVRPAKRAGLNRLLFLLLLLLSVSFFAVSGIVLVRPDALGLEQRVDIRQTEISFDATAQGLEVAASNLLLTAQYNADVAFNNDSTRIALENQQTMLNQSATQVVADAQASETARANANAQQATQSALDFQATQVAFERAATEVELAYRGTQSALNRDATAIALGFATNAPSAEDVLTATPPPTQTTQPLFTDGFQAGVQGGIWDFSSAADWSLNTGGVLISDRSGAWLLSQIDTLTSYSYELDLRPLQGAQFAADYHVLLNVQAEPQAPNGYALRITYDGSRVTAVGLHTFSLVELFEGDGLLGRSLPAIRSEQVSLAAAEQIRLRVELRGQQVSVAINGQPLLQIQLDNMPLPGAVGLQIPEGAGIASVTLLP